jgi:hypothetical protein
MREQTKKRLKQIFIVLLIALGFYLSNGLRHAGYTGTPDWIDACGRSYVRPGPVLTRAEALSDDLVVVGTVQVWFKHLNVWAMEPSYYRTGYLSCGVIAYVEFDDDEFRAYSLSGGV